jgi:hypothetical protein
MVIIRPIPLIVAVHVQHLSAEITTRRIISGFAVLPGPAATHIRMYINLHFRGIRQGRLQASLRGTPNPTNRLVQNLDFHTVCCYLLPIETDREQFLLLNILTFFDIK